MRGLAPSEEKIKEITRLRSLGNSFSEISRAVSIPQTTVYKYAHTTKVKDEYLDLWRSKRGGSSKTKAKKQLLYENWAQKFLKPKLTEREKILFLSAIYWGEGSKRDLEIINSDPRLLKVFLNLLRTYFKLDNQRLYAYLRIFPGVSKEQSIKFWSEFLSIPAENFTGFEIVDGKKVGKLPYGMCRLRIRKGADILKQITAINKTLATIV